MRRWGCLELVIGVGSQGLEPGLRRHLQLTHVSIFKSFSRGLHAPCQVKSSQRVPPRFIRGVKEKDRDAHGTVRVGVIGDLSVTSARDVTVRRDIRHVSDNVEFCAAALPPARAATLSRVSTLRCRQEKPYPNLSHALSTVPVLPSPYTYMYS